MFDSYYCTKPSAAMRTLLLAMLCTEEDMKCKNQIAFLKLQRANVSVLLLHPGALAVD